MASRGPVLCVPPAKNVEAKDLLLCEKANKSSSLAEAFAKDKRPLATCASGRFEVLKVKIIVSRTLEVPVKYDLYCNDALER